MPVAADPTPLYPETVTTDRLRLRRFRLDDGDWYAAMNADADVMRFIGRGVPLTRAESDQSLAGIEAHWADHGFGLWAAERRDNDEPIGFIGLSAPSFLPEVLPAVEVGWRLARPHWGHGFATEGARVAIGHGFTTLGLARLVSITVHDNLSSQRVMAKLGLTWDRAAVHPQLGAIVEVRAISRSAWEAKQKAATGSPTKATGDASVAGPRR